MPLILNVIGVGRKSGKTSIIEALTRELTKRKYKVSTIKHISRGSFDTAQKDTWKHLQAGAEEVVAMSPRELVSIRRISEPLLGTAIDEMGEDVDLILVEGFKRTGYPKIIAAQTLEEVKELMGTAKEVFAISGPIVGTIELKSFEGIPILEPHELIPKIEELVLEDMVEKLPRLNCRKCGYNSCEALAQAILRREAPIDRCRPLLEEEVVLTVDGKRVFLSEFPSNFMKNVVLGMVKSLKGVNIEKLKRVSLTISLK